MEPISVVTLAGILNKGTVVAIDPQENYRSALRLYLNKMRVADFRIFDSVEATRGHLPDMIVSVFIVEWAQIGETNGLQFCREVRGQARTRSTPFVLVSTESLRSDVILASEVGIDSYLLKPFSYQDFCNQIYAAVRKADDNAKFHHLIDHAEREFAAGNYVDAERLFLESSDYQPNSARVKCGVGQIKRVQGQIVQAEEAFKEAISANSEYIEAYVCLLELYQETKQAHHLLHYALKLHQMSPDNPRYVLMVAKTYLEIGNVHGSEEFFRKVVRISPTIAECHKGLGDIHMLKEEYNEAMNCYEKALDIDHNDVAILNSMGLVLVKQGLFADGIQKYALALSIEPNNAKVLFNIGYAHEKGGNLELARDYYNKSLINQPDFEKPKRGLVRVSRRLPPKN